MNVECKKLIQVMEKYYLDNLEYLIIVKFKKVMNQI
jgi:hypothetical protein